MSGRVARTLIVAVVACLLALAGIAAYTGALQSLWQVRMGAEAAPPALTTKYQAVFMDNGQVYFGQISGLGTAYPSLTDVYYVQRQIDPKAKTVKNILVSAAGQWNAPDRMVLNARHIVAIEPVSPTSTVVKLIAELKSKQP